MLENQPVRIIAYSALKLFGENNAGTMSSIVAFYKIAKSKEVEWNKPQDVVKIFGAARVDILQNDRVCIDIGGNKLRIILKIEYGHGLAFARWIGWHKNYTKLGEKIHFI